MIKTLDRVPLHRLPEIIDEARPAIVTDMFAGQSLEQITDMQHTRDLLGQMKVSINMNYIDGHLERIRHYRRGVPMPPQLGRTRGTFADYLDLIARDPATRSVISEEPTPESLLNGIDLSSIGIDTVLSGNPALNAEVPPTTAYSLIFAANRGNSSDMHADGDGRDVLLYQGFGRKRVILFPPEAAPHLHPIAGYSTVRVSAMNEKDRHAFLDYAGGVEYTLLPGEAIFMPALIWHHFDYLEPALSVIFRFGGISHPDAKELMRRVHLDYHVQNILAGTRNPACAEACLKAARCLIVASKQSYTGTQAKYRAMRALTAECHKSILTPEDSNYLGAIVEAEDFLDGGLSGFYSRPPEGPEIVQRLWGAQEKTRDTLRRLGRMLSYWA